jgi:hypothetical protein
MVGIKHETLSHISNSPTSEMGILWAVTTPWRTVRHAENRQASRKQPFANGTRQAENGQEQPLARAQEARFMSEAS